MDTNKTFVQLDNSCTHDMTINQREMSSALRSADVSSERASNQSYIPKVNVYNNIPFAGGDGDYSILSVLHGPHSIGGGIFGYLNMIDSNKVRAQCVECREAVKEFPWMDIQSRIKGSVKSWRAAFPVARCANVSERNDIVDADFIHIRGDARVRLHTVIMSNCHKVTDAAFIHLRGIRALHMSWCYQETITYEAFAHLRGIHTLDIRSCGQLTPLALAPIAGIVKLRTKACSRAVRVLAAEMINHVYDSDEEFEGNSDSEYEWQSDEESDEDAVDFDDDDED